MFRGGACDDDKYDGYPSNILRIAPDWRDTVERGT